MKPGFYCRAAGALLLAAHLAACATAKYSPEDERTRFQTFQSALFEGMPVSKLHKQAGREPLLTAVDLNNNYLTYQFETPGDNPARHFQYVTVTVNRATNAVVSWE